MAEVTRVAPGLQSLAGGENSWRRKLEVPELIHFIDAYETPFYTFTSKVTGKAPTPDYKFYTQEHRPLPDIGVVTAILTGPDATWDADDESGTNDNVGQTGDTVKFKVGLSGTTSDNSFFYPNLVVKNVPTATGSTEWTAVITNVSSDGETVTAKLISKHDGSTDYPNASDPNVADKLLFMSTAYPDGVNRGTVISKDNTRDYNFTQIMRMPIEVTKRMAASELHGNLDKLAMIKRDAIRHWKRLAERSFLLGSRYEDTAASGSYERTTTEGFITWFKRRALDNADCQNIYHTDPALSAYTYDHFMADMEKVFLFKTGNKKIMLCDRSVISHFNSSTFLGSNGRWSFDTSTNAYGIAKWIFTCPFGTLELIECPALADYNPWATGPTTKHTGVIVDPGSVRQRVLEDVHWEDTSVNGIALVGQQELYGDIGLEFNCPENNALITWDAA